ncbi:MAG: hypothetical protein WBP41_17720 [Saprospiraceae bacterium]
MKPILLYLLGLILLLSCHKDSDTEILVVDKPDPPAVIISTKLVTLSDTTSAYTAHSHQYFAAETASFDALPYAYTKGSLINRDFEPIRLITTDNLEFLNIQSLIENDVNYVHWNLPVIKTYSGQTIDPSEFIVNAFSKIVIPAHALTFLNGDAYDGAFKIFAADLDPHSDQVSSIPSFTGLNTDHEQISLLFDHCFFVEAKSSDGEKLKFKEGAFISTSSSLPSGTWYFQKAKGIWIQTDALQQNKIILSESGYYGEAIEKTLIRVKGTLDINGIPAINQPITITYAGLQRTVYTTNSGRWAIQVPASTECKAQIDLTCNQSFQKIFITTTESQMEMPIHIENTSFSTSVIKGIARDCDANPLKDHIIILRGIQNTFIYNSDPDINISLPVCSGSLIGISDANTQNAQSGPTISWTPKDTIDIHSVFACVQARNEYLTLTVSGEHKIYWDLKSSINAQHRLIIENTNLEPELQFQIAVTGNAPGQYTDNMLNILFEDMHLGTKGYSLNCPTSSSCGFTDFTLTHYAPQSGEWIRGYFTGRFWIKTFNPLTAGYRSVEGEFQVYREF